MCCLHKCMHKKALYTELSFQFLVKIMTSDINHIESSISLCLNIRVLTVTTIKQAFCSTKIIFTYQLFFRFTQILSFKECDVFTVLTQLRLIYFVTHLFLTNTTSAYVILFLLDSVFSYKTIFINNKNIAIFLDKILYAILKLIQ